MLNEFGAHNRFVGRLSAVSLATVLAVCGCAQQSSPNASQARAQSSTQAQPASQPGSDKAQQRDNARSQKRSTSQARPKLQLADDAPQRYTVQKGDTLWDLSATFIQDPWHWPQLWAQNPDIDNPNLIYPGETLVLTRTMSGRLRLQPASGQKLQPKIHAKPLDAAIPALPEESIHVFVHGDRIVSTDTVEDAPHILAFDDSRPTGTTGRRTYIKGLDNDGSDRYQIVHPMGPLKDPDSDTVYGTKVRNVGEIKVSERADVSTARITNSKRTAVVGDHLLPIPTRPLDRGYHPHAPSTQIRAEVVDLSGEQPVATQYQVVTVSAGARDGLDRGAILGIHAPGRTVNDPESGNEVTLPDHKIGSVMVFKTAPRYAFALVMSSDETVSRGAMLRSPSQ